MSLESSKALIIVQENLNDVKDLPKGDFLTNGIYCIARTKHDIYFYKFGFETEVRNVSMEKNIVNLSMNDQHVLILQDYQFSVLNLNNEEIQLKGQSSVQLISTSSNPHVVSILDAQNTINLFTWTGNIFQMFIINLFYFSISDKYKPSNLLAYKIPQSPPPHLLIHQSFHIP